ncbi:MAG: VTT domain-containing protein [Flavobacteriales bacterium]|nr:VTT domain-containing protein [Flavobacteriales bacterium]
MNNILDFVLHIDEKLAFWIQEYGTTTYVILFTIVFVETGLVIMPLLPGDSLLFAAGALCAQDTGLRLEVLIPLLIGAALLGDNVNYFIGKFLGNQIKKRERILFFKRAYIDRTEAFYAKHGGKTVIMARFIPIVRTIAPFVAGAGSMPYSKYITYCIAGAVLWVPGLSLLGYWFGNNKFVKENFETVILAIIFISVLPIIIAALRHRFRKEKS